MRIWTRRPAMGGGDLTAETTRATGAEQANTMAINDHVNDADAAHAASAISVNPSGLIVVTGTDVQAAIAQLAAAVKTAQDTANAVGSVEVAYSENGSGIVTGPVAGANNGYGVPVTIPLTDIVVPANPRPVYLDAWTLTQQMVVGAGVAVLEIWETTAAAVALSRSISLLPNSTTLTARNASVYHPPVRLGPVASQRSFQLRLNCFGIGATPSVQTPNTNATGFKTWLRAMAA